MQEPIEDKLIREGFLITKVDIDKQPELAAAYHIQNVPTTVCIARYPNGVCYELGRIEGLVTEGQLRRLAVLPVITTVGAATRNAIRAVFGCPIWEW